MYDPRIIDVLSDVTARVLEEARSRILVNVARELGIEPGSIEEPLNYKKDTVGYYQVEAQDEGLTVRCRPLNPVSTQGGPFQWLKKRLNSSSFSYAHSDSGDISISLGTSDDRRKVLNWVAWAYSRLLQEAPGK